MLHPARLEYHRCELWVISGTASPNPRSIEDEDDDEVDAPCEVDAPARPRDGGANQAVTAVHDSYRAPYPDLYLSLPRSDCDRGTLVP
jgi:hypothetical protein